MKNHFPTESSPSPFRGDDGDDTYYKVVRLKTGENIFCSMVKNVTSVASEPYLTLVHPVLGILSKQMSKDDNIVGELFILRPWIGSSSSTEFVIPTDIVLTIADLNRNVRNQYLEYLEEIRRANKMIEREEDKVEREKALFKLLSEVNPGKKVHIIKDE